MYIRSINLKHYKGIGLLEIAIAITIIGFIVAAIMGSLSIVEKSKQNSVISEYVNLTKATTEFIKIYGGIPGDLAQISTLPGVNNVAGNGNGIIDSVSESDNFWAHLKKSKLIHIKSNPIAGNINPPGAMDNSELSIMDDTSFATLAGVNLSPKSLVLEFRGINNTSIMTPKDAKAMDAESDDGKPFSGTILAQENSANECIDANGEYNTSNEAKACKLLFVINSKPEIETAMTGQCTEIGSIRKTRSPRSCPEGYEGTITRTCRINSNNRGFWRVTSKDCDPIKCDNTYSYGDTKRSKCPFGKVGQDGIVKSCTKIGTWKIISSDCEIPVNTRCEIDGLTTIGQACPEGEEGTIIQQCFSSTYGVPSIDNCQPITCRASNYGEITTVRCGLGYTGRMNRVCGPNGRWIITGSGNTCVPRYGSCNNRPDKDIGCPRGQTGSHILHCVDKPAGRDYWATKSNNCVTKTCTGGFNIGAVRVKEDAQCPRKKSGTMFEFCDITGEWVEDDSNCSKSCDTGEDELGFAIWPSVSAGTSNVQAIKCIEGYEPSSPGILPTRNCNNNSTWNKNVLNECIPSSCPAVPFPVAAPESLFPKSLAGTKKVRGRCIYPEYEGSPTNRCKVDGAWKARKGCYNSALPKKDELVVWFDAADRVSVFRDSECTKFAKPGRSKVGCWYDKSGNPDRLDTLQVNFDAKNSNPNSMPSYRFKSLNNKNTISFDGINDNLILPSNFSHPASDYTMFIVTGNEPNLTTNQFLFDTQSGRLGFIISENEIALRTGAFDSGIAGNYSTNEQLLVYELSNINGGLMFRDGLQTTVSPISYSATAIGGRTKIGSGYDGATYHFKGDIGEIILYNNILSATDKQDTVDHLVDKWDIDLTSGVVASSCVPSDPSITHIMGMPCCPAGDLNDIAANHGCGKLFGTDHTNINEVGFYAGDVPGGSTDIFVQRCDGGVSYNSATNSCNKDACPMGRFKWHDSSTNPASNSFRVARVDNSGQMNLPAARNGLPNTQAINSSSSTDFDAANHCYSLPSGTTGKWYLPGISELNETHSNLISGSNAMRDSFTILNNPFRDKYWSSSVANTRGRLTAWYMRPHNGSLRITSNNGVNRSLRQRNYVRCMRRD